MAARDDGADDALIGKTLEGRYQLLKRVGHGGMAVVYQARDLSLLREVAVKVLHPHLAEQPASRARIQREAQAVAKLQHPDILQIFDSAGAGAQATFLVTEFIHGPTLRAFLQAHPPVYPEQGALIVAALADALAAAHAAGVVHRDVKPENVMVAVADGRRTIKLLDLGIAKLREMTLASVGSETTLTHPGQIMGTPYYMSPEQVRSTRDVDARADIWSLGVVLFELITGQQVWRAEELGQLVPEIIAALSRRGAEGVSVVVVVAGTSTGLTVPDPTNGVITINSATDNGGAATSTATDILAAILAKATVMALLASAALTSGSNGSGVVGAIASTALPFGSSATMSISGAPLDAWQVRVLKSSALQLSAAAAPQLNSLDY